MRILNREAVEKLANGIVVQAVKDYKEALINYRQDPNYENKYKMQELLDFFHSPWCSTLTSINVDMLLQMVEDDTLKNAEFILNAYKKSQCSIKQLEAKLKVAKEKGLMDKIKQIQERINQRIDKSLEEKKTLQILIGKVEDRKVALLLILRYIRLMSVRQIAKRWKLKVYDISCYLQKAIAIFKNKVVDNM